jgi:hypothetical protein
VRLGLEWLAARGQIAVRINSERVALQPAGEAPDAERTRQIEASLAAELQESAAFRAYLRAADADRLLNKAR